MILRKNFIIIFLTISLSLILFGCGKQVENKPSKIINIYGSSSFAPFIEASAKEFSKAHSEYQINVNSTNSQSALEQLFEGTIDIAMSDCFAYEKISPEKAKELSDNIICVQGYSIIVNPSVTISSISIKNAISIYAGRITNWRYVDGENVPIVAFSRDSASGTKTIFRKYGINGIIESEKKIKQLPSNIAVKKAVSSTPGGIGYVALSLLQNDNSVRKINLDNVEPSAENIKSGKYPLWSYQHLYTKSKENNDLKTFIEYLKSPLQKDQLRKMGYIPIDEMNVTR